MTMLLTIIELSFLIVGFLALLVIVPFLLICVVFYLYDAITGKRYEGDE